MAEVQFLPAAEADARAAVAWYRERSDSAAEGFEKALADAIEGIAANPELYAFIDHRHRQCLLKKFPYSVIYRVEPDHILVIAVAHSKRSSAFWQGRG